MLTIFSGERYDFLQGENGSYGIFSRIYRPLGVIYEDGRGKRAGGARKKGGTTAL
jgi:hypothetical protein